MKIYETLPQILERLQELEEEQKQLWRNLKEIQKECIHQDSQGRSFRKRSHFDGIKDVWVCSKCGKELK